ncbi:hypothetical protein GCM10009786_27580 [Leucobacter alluvii]|uniref:Uncharacterized protein n=1 Tax=Leucobacter alluvii TaxID=340321 RepID=A0ABN3B936_9MICO
MADGDATATQPEKDHVRGHIARLHEQVQDAEETERERDQMPNPVILLRTGHAFEPTVRSEDA